MMDEEKFCDNDVDMVDVEVKDLPGQELDNGQLRRGQYDDDDQLRRRGQFDEINVRLSMCCTQGGRKYMEDRMHVHVQRKPEGQVEYIFLGVFDGHGGADASQYAKDHLRRAITDQKAFYSDDDASVLKAIKDGFIETHNGMWKTFEKWPRTASGYPSTSGTTASIAIIKNSRVYVGHVGDSAVVIGQNDGLSLKGQLLTVDHKPDSPEEIRRICETGGEVMNKSGVMRVVWTRPSKGHQGPVRRSTSIEKIPFLAVARALGDLWSYNSVMDRFVVSPEPDLNVLRLDQSQHKCVILGSDGLWNVIKPDLAVEIVTSYDKNAQDIVVSSSEDSVAKPLPLETNHARYLVRHALRRWGALRADNISAIALILDGSVTSPTLQCPTVVAEDPNLHIDSILTQFPTGLIRITDETTQILRTRNVDIQYTGASDTVHSQHSSAFAFKGPGYNPVRMIPKEAWPELPAALSRFLICNNSNDIFPLVSNIPAVANDIAIVSAGNSVVLSGGSVNVTSIHAVSLTNSCSDKATQSPTARSYAPSSLRPPSSSSSSSPRGYKRAAVNESSTTTTHTTTTSLSIGTPGNEVLIKVTTTMPPSGGGGNSKRTLTRGESVENRLSPRNSSTQTDDVINTDYNNRANVTPTGTAAAIDTGSGGGNNGRRSNNGSSGRKKTMMHIIVTTPKRQRLMTPTSSNGHHVEDNQYRHQPPIDHRQLATSARVTTRTTTATITYKSTSTTTATVATATLKRRSHIHTTVCSHSSSPAATTTTTATATFYNLRRSGRLLTRSVGKAAGTTSPRVSAPPVFDPLTSVSNGQQGPIQQQRQQQKMSPPKLQVEHQSLNRRRRRTSTGSRYCRRRGRSANRCWRRRLSLRRCKKPSASVPSMQGASTVVPQTAAVVTKSPRNCLQY